ncbi:MAG TPA: DUF2569 family protein [Candidatus Acidoferrum sp.]|nr:DUF2569 family protein [Candidatus Acidoferrum sp.]
MGSSPAPPALPQAPPQNPIPVARPLAPPSSPAQSSGNSWVDVGKSPPIAPPAAPAPPQVWPPQPQTFAPSAAPNYYPPLAQQYPPAQPYPSAQYPYAAAIGPAPAAPVGVGGWLMFFVLCLTVFGPLLSLFSLIVLLIAAGELASQRPEFITYAVVEALLIVPTTVWGLMVGVSLWKARPGAVRRAKQFLLFVYMPATFLVSVLPFLFLPPADRVDTAGTTAVTTIIIDVAFTLIWRSYLTKSRRVAATYPQG